MKNWFEGCADEKEVKKVYRDLCKSNHPDRGGDVEIMKEINNAYEAAMRKEYSKNYEAESVEDFMRQEAQMMEVLEKILNLDGLVIDIVGRWIWLTGETKKHKDAIGKNGAGFWWSKQKKAWYWRSPEHKFARKNKPMSSLDELKKKFDSKTFKSGSNKSGNSKKTANVLKVGYSS